MKQIHTDSQVVKETASGEGLLPRPLLAWLAPYAVAVCAAMFSLQGALHSDIVVPDSARHAMNGALIHDWIRSGDLADPVTYAKNYYAHLPATSLPYHPPLFPAIEACLFGIFGVNVFVARLLIAISVAVCALLLFKCVAGAYGSHLLALATVITFFSLKNSIWCATDVMLEFPAFAIALGSLVFLRLVDGQWRLRDGLLFAVLGGAAVWTKQHAVFIGLVPFAYIVVSRRWHLLRGKTLWISTGAFTLLVAGLLITSLSSAGVGVSGQVVVSAGAVDNLIRNVQKYSNWYISALGIVPGIVCALSAAVFLAQRLFGKQVSDRHDLILSWAISVFAMVIVLQYPNPRYILYAYPPLIAIGYYAVAESCRRMLSNTAVGLVVPICVALVVIPNLVTMTISQLRGPGDAARFVIDQGAVRVMYCGESSGAFTFTVRSLGEPLERWVLRGDKLESLMYEPQTFEALLHRYGIEYVVFEDNAFEHDWDVLAVSPPPSLQLVREFELNMTLWANYCGTLRVFRNSNPSPEPDDPTLLQLSTIGANLGKYTGVQNLLDTLNE